jgi:murein DD-endopeptidase MepM/ murein hydrolase activator NlpD
VVKWLSIFLCLLTSVTQAQVELMGDLTQGSLLRGKVSPGGQLLLDDKKIQVAPTGEFAFGFGRDDGLSHTLVHINPKGEKTSQTIQLRERTYDVQRIEGVAQKYVSPPESVLSRIRKDNQMIGKARKTNHQRLDFMQDFIWPAEGPIAGVYGSQRVFNGEPKRPHFGVDVAGPVGTKVVAPADGIVTLFVPDMYYSGGTMIIDHGYGVSSTFLHLSRSHVKEGDQVIQGQLVAEIGATGRVTGPHLDWRVNWFNVRLDPALLVPNQQ